MSQKVLIIEDDTWLADDLCQLLVAEGYTVEVSPHALSAIDTIDSFHPDCLVLDVLLPGTTGFTLLHELQSYDDTGKLPVIICSSIAGDLKKEELAPYGVHRLLDKTTMTPADIVAAVRSAL